MALRSRYSRSRLAEYVSAHVTALIEGAPTPEGYATGFEPRGDEPRGFGAYPGDQGDCLRQEGLGFVIMQSHERSSYQSVRERLDRDGAVEYMVEILDVVLREIVKDGATVDYVVHKVLHDVRCKSVQHDPNSHLATVGSLPSVAAVRALMASMAAQEELT